MSSEPDDPEQADDPPEERPPEPGPPVRYQADHPAALITLNRPGRRNALSGDVILGVHAALDMALDDPQVRAVVITGDGSAFCSGLDLHETEDEGQRSYEEVLADADALARLIEQAQKQAAELREDGAATDVEAADDGGDGEEGGGR